MIIIIMSMFINRTEELKLLNEIYKSRRAELVLVYGRRRVGKSRLLLESVKNKEALYLLADTSENILDILAGQIKNEFVNFSSWENFFEFIYKSNYKIIIIDEFQYLYQVDKSWPTKLQRWWEQIKETDKKIILCGSIISTIYKIAQGYGSALYGRKTREIEILPLSWVCLKDFFKTYSINDIVRLYGTVGGIPRYIEEFNAKESIEENIKNKILEKTSFLYNEPMNLLYEEFRDATPYISILLALSQGETKFNEIANASKIAAHKLSKYLTILERVKLIDKEIPITENKIKTRFTRYKIKDNFYRFWFRFIFKNKASIEQGINKEILDYIKIDFNSYIGSVFEEVCRESIIKNTALLTFTPTKIGRWWHKDIEIDIVALNEKTKNITFAECKWQDQVEVKKILSQLKNKANSVNWNNDKRKENYIIFAKSFLEKIKEPNLRLYDIHDMEKILSSIIN